MKTIITTIGFALVALVPLAQASGNGADGYRKLNEGSKIVQTESQEIFGNMQLAHSGGNGADGYYKLKEWQSGNKSAAASNMTQQLARASGNGADGYNKLKERQERA